MKRHTVSGVEIIRGIEDNTQENDFLKYAETLAISHHEKWDGTGYPYGLKGNEIPLMGRLMTIVDVYDALTNDRPYKKAYSHEESFEIIKNGFGKQFDPLIEEVLLAHETEFKNAAADITPGAPGYRPQAMREFNPVLDMVSNIVETRSGAENRQGDKIRRYMEIFINAVIKREHFKEEVSAWNTNLLLMSAQLHDVGMITLDDNILYKKDTLTENEYESVKSHTEAGVKVIRQIMGNVENENVLYHAEVMARSHHEKWDGTGYPLGLKGEQIPLQGRIMAIVDVYDALTKNRPHRDMMPHKQALDVIRGCAGTHFDPGLIDVFLSCERDLEKVGRA